MADVKEDDPLTWFPGAPAAPASSAPASKAAPASESTVKESDPLTWFPSKTTTTTQQPPADQSAPVAIGDTLVSPDDAARINAPPSNPPITSLEDLRARIQQADQSAQESLKPSPDDNALTYAGKAVGSLGVHLLGNLASLPVNALIGLTGGGGWSQSGNITVDPATGAERLSPEASTVASFAANPLRTGGPVPPLVTSEFRANPLDPGAASRMASREAGPTEPSGVRGTPNVGPAPPPSGSPSGPDVAPTTASGGTTGTPTTSAEALPVARRLLDKAKNSGADLQPDYVNRFIDKVTADAEPAGPGTAAVSGPGDPVAAMVQRLQALRDQPLNIKDVMGMDQELNARQRAAIKTDPDLARRLGALQDSLRDQVDAATQADVGGGADGWNAFKDGRAAYSQYKKMQAVEDMKERADGTQNPTTSYKTAVNNFVNGPKSRGWSDEEKASLVDSANRGAIGGALHMLGGRLVPYMAGAAAFGTTGATEALASMVAAHYGGQMVRNVENALQTRRFNRTMGVLGSGIPPNALSPQP